MTTQRVTFSGSVGSKLVGQLEKPHGEASGYALFAHCFTCSKDFKAAVWISRALCDHGIAVLRFDFTGLGESEGDFADTNFSSNLGDLAAAASFLRTEYQAPRLLVGHSLGGTAMLAIANDIPECVAVSTIASPAGTEHLRNTLVRKAPDLERAGEAEVDVGGRPFRVRSQMLDDLEAHHVRNAVQRLGRALLIFHSPVDTVVGPEQASLLFQAAQHPKSFVSLGTADHLLVADPRDAPYVGHVLAAWASRYLAP